MRVTGVVVALVAIAGCKKAPRQYTLNGGFGDALGPVSAVVNGTEIHGGVMGYPLPPGQGPESIKTLALRYQTPCGPFDVPNDITERGAGIIMAKPGAPRLHRHTVIVDSRDEASHDVRIGSLQLGPGDGPPNTDPDGWKQASLGLIFGTECGPSHKVTFNGSQVGTLEGTPPDGYGDTPDARAKLPIFVTPRHACYRLQRLATETVEKRNDVVVGSQAAFEVRFAGPGAFYLRAMPDVFLKPPTSAAAPTGLYEVPCDPQPAAP